MAISGSQKAYKQARAGIERSGASRAGYYTYNTIVTINGVTVTGTAVLKGSVRLTLNINDQPDTCAFTLKPGYTATVGHTVVIAIGDTTYGRLFAGQIVRKRHIRRPGNETPWIEIEGVDWSRLFNRRLVTTHYANQSASDIVAAIIDTFTSGFTRINVQTGLDTIDFLPAVFDTPLEALRRVATMIGGAFYIDPNRDVHFFGASGETGARAPTAPLSLTNSRTTLKAFAYSTDQAQQRTRTLVQTKGSTTSVPLAIGMLAIPIEDGSNLTSPGDVAAHEYGVIPVDLAITTVPYLATAVRTGAAVGATTLEVNDLSLVAALSVGHAGWVRIGTRYLYFTGGTVTVAPAGNLTGIPASGTGSILTAVAIGEIVENIPMVGLAAADALTRALPQGTTIVQVTTRDDAAAQATQAALEGGDGIHEAVITDDRFDLTSAATLGDDDLDNFKGSLVTAEWETEDMNARVGAQQVIALTVTDPLSTTLVITAIDVEFRSGPTDLPRRHCKGDVVRVARLLDVMVTAQGR